MLRRFTLHEPESLKDVPILLSKYGDDGAILAGGTELLLVMKQGVARFEHLINIKNIPGLDRIDYDENEDCLKIGPLVTHRDLEKSNLVKDKFPVIVEMEKQIGNIRVRNVGTVAGNLCFAEPRSDVGNLLLALKAKVRAIGTNGEREIDLEDFCVDIYETALKEDEVLTEILIPSLPQNSNGTYLRFALSEWPTVGVAVILTLESEDNESVRDATITLGSVNPTPIRARKAEEAIRGKAIGEVLANLEQIGGIAAEEIDPIEDMHASEWYKRERVKAMVKRGIQKTYDRWVKGERE